MSEILIGKYQGTIYPEGDGFTAAIDLGFDGAGRRQRVKRKGKTKAAVKDKLKQLVEEREKGIQTDKATENYSVKEAVNDWLATAAKKLVSRVVS